MFNIDMFQQSGHFAGIYGILQCSYKSISSYCIDIYIYTHTHIVYTVHIYISHYLAVQQHIMLVFLPPGLLVKRIIFRHNQVGGSLWYTMLCCKITHIHCT